MKRYVELAENATATHIKIETRYNLGGLGFASYTPEPRGYYLHVTPVTRETRNGYTLESFTAFTGVKQVLKTVSRRSAKAEAAAEEIAKNYLHSMVLHVCEKNGLPVPPEFIYGEVKTV